MNLQKYKNIVLKELSKKKWEVKRIKETTSEQSIYIYTKEGVIRISSHHNKLSAEKCLCSIVLPSSEQIAKKMIKFL